MSLTYSIKEAMTGFAKARLSTAITIFTVFFLLFFLGIVAILTLNMNRLVSTLNANHDVQVFLANTLTDEDIDQVKSEIAEMSGVLDVHYISKEAAAREFKKEFGDNIFDALGENPLPASLVVKVDQRLSNPERLIISNL